MSGLKKILNELTGMINEAKRKASKMHDNSSSDIEFKITSSDLKHEYAWDHFDKDVFSAIQCRVNSGANFAYRDYLQEGNIN